MPCKYPELSGERYRELTGTDRDRYEWLVGFFLWSAEELLEFKAREDVWTINLQMLAKYHKEYLNSPEFKAHELKTYSAKTQALIRRAIESPQCFASEGDPE